jgi:hypothetical protein
MKHLKALSGITIFAVWITGLLGAPVNPKAATAKVTYSVKNCVGSIYDYTSCVTFFTDRGCYPRHPAQGDFACTRIQEGYIENSGVGQRSVTCTLTQEGGIAWTYIKEGHIGRSSVGQPSAACILAQDRVIAWTCIQKGYIASSSIRQKSAACSLRQGHHVDLHPIRRFCVIPHPKSKKAPTHVLTSNRHSRRRENDLWTHAIYHL